MYRSLLRWLSHRAIAPLPYEPGPASIRRTLLTQKNRGIHAATILADPLIAEALAALERRAHEAWANSAASELQLREQAFWRLRAAAGFRAELAGMIRDGKIAEDEIDSNERLAEGRRQQENP